MNTEPWKHPAMNVAEIPGTKATRLTFDPVRVFNRSQSAYLDGVRGSAAQLVLLHHALGYCLPGSALAGLGGGPLGVLAFFLLSGFLITDNIRSRIAASRFSYTEFAVSRFSRIYTPYVPALLLVVLLDRYSQRSPTYEYAADFHWPTGVANLFMLQDYPVFQILRRLHVPDQPWFFKTFGSGRQFWTVSIEWWIYLAVGMATYLVLRRRPPSPVQWLVLGFFAVEPLYNLIGGPGDCLTLAWLLGGAANLAYRRLAADPRLAIRLGRGRCILAWCALLVLACARLLFTHGRIYDAVFAALFAGLLFLPLLLWLGPAERAPWLRLDLLSFHSYSLYLTHGSLVVFLVARYGDALLGWRGLALIFVACNLVAMPFAVAFELPHRRIRQAILRALRT